MLTLAWLDLDVNEATALQFGLIKGLLSPITLIGWAHHIKREIQKVVGKSVNIRESVAWSIFNQQMQQERCTYLSYEYGDKQFMKKRIFACPKQSLLMDLYLQLETDDLPCLKEALKSASLQNTLKHIHLARSFCHQKIKEPGPMLLDSEDALYNTLLSRPIHGFLSTQCQWVDHYQHYTEHHDVLDALLHKLHEGKEFQHIHGYSNVFPIVSGLRFLGSPKHRHHSRGGYHHAFAEPLLTLAQPLYLFHLKPGDSSRIFWRGQWQDQDYLAINTHP